MIDFPSSDRDFEQALRFLAQKMPDANELPKPTLLHSVRVGLYLYHHNYDTSICIAGLLHDLVEDAGVTVEDISNEFGDLVAQLVRANTKNEKLPEEERYEALLQSCINNGEPASIVKAADIIDNLITYKKYNIEQGINNMLHFGKILLKLKPERYADKIFTELDRLVFTNH